LIFALFELAGGVETELQTCVVYDLDGGGAHFGAARVDGRALVWTLDDGQALVTQCHKGILPSLTKGVTLDRGRWIVRCDRVEFPPGAVAHRHVHPGPGIRRLLHGELTIERADGGHAYRAGEAWFEDGNDPVLAKASPTEETAFVRVLLLPAEWAGKRTIRYLNPGDDEQPKLQRATILVEEPIEL
jgi:quercetin dioxygenase-like cupin family protein